MLPKFEEDYQSDGGESAGEVNTTFGLYIWIQRVVVFPFFEAYPAKLAREDRML